MNFLHISKIAKFTLTAVLIVPSLFISNVNSAQAGVNIQAHGRVTNLSLTVKNDRTQTQQNNRGRSIQDRQIEIPSQAVEDYDRAVEKYKIALNIDPSNGDVWLLAGELLGNTEDGIKFARIAAQLFKLQGDDRGYQSAIDLLKRFGASD
jgi:tetratricopeptide (TPR) repeat protein